MMKSLLCTAILLFAAISLASATGIIIDTAHHHPGDDFEFSNLGIRITKTEPVTIEPPLKVAWTHDLSRPYPDSSGMPPISVIADGAIYLGKGGIKAIDANTGKIRWANDLDADPRGNDWDLGYNEGTLYALNSHKSPNIYALDAKTGKVLWSKEYTNIGGNPIILGNTLYAVTPDDRYVFAIDTANGNLE